MYQIDNDRRKTIEAGARDLSIKNNNMNVQVYSTPFFSLWIRFDDTPLAIVDGTVLIHLATFRNGERTYSK